MFSGTNTVLSGQEDDAVVTTDDGVFTVTGYKPLGYVLYAGDSKDTAVVTTKISDLKMVHYIAVRQKDLSKMKAPKAAGAIGGLKVSWSRYQGVDGYVLYRSTTGKKYSVLKKFTSDATVSYTDKAVKITSYRTLTKTISKLRKGKTYSVSVRAYKKVGSKCYYSAYSSTKKVKVSK